jgi:hypothetical protein
MILIVLGEAKQPLLVREVHAAVEKRLGVAFPTRRSRTPCISRDETRPLGSRGCGTERIVRRLRNGADVARIRLDLDRCTLSAHRRFLVDGVEMLVAAGKRERLE